MQDFAAIDFETANIIYFFIGHNSWESDACDDPLELYRNKGKIFHFISHFPMVFLSQSKMIPTLTFGNPQSAKRDR